eukprot:1196023-Prorocentrum_minimum.AAC.2
MEDAHDYKREMCNSLGVRLALEERKEQLAAAQAEESEAMKLKSEELDDATKMVLKMQRQQTRLQEALNAAEAAVAAGEEQLAVGGVTIVSHLRVSFGRWRDDYVTPGGSLLVGGVTIMSHCHTRLVSFGRWRANYVTPAGVSFGRWRDDYVTPGWSPLVGGVMVARRLCHAGLVSFGRWRDGNVLRGSLLAGGVRAEAGIGVGGGGADDGAEATAGGGEAEGGSGGQAQVGPGGGGRGRGGAGGGAGVPRGGADGRQEAGA